MVLGHDLNEGPRTQDVRISVDVSFDTMLLTKTTLEGLKKAGFLKPSPIQLHGIPLGKCGFDLLLEAKSGTGKTAVFTVISLEKLDLNKGIQSIIMAPTREIASQISAVITEIGSQYNGLNVAVVMGGLPVKDDVEKFSENVHIVVGSPGRLRHLIQDDHLDLSAVRLLVLDEADKLMEKSFLPDINYIFSLLPKQKQVIMCSATFSEETKSFISKYVQRAQHICPDSNNVLLGIAQKVALVPYNSNIVKQTKHRYEELKKILDSKQFKQCLIFCNYQVRVGELHRMLTRDKWPAEQLYGQQDQTDRLDALKTLQEYKCRILVSTDLAARGIDASNVDVVINFEPPLEWQTYLHRIGRAGRYGSYGTAISILSTGKEMTKFKETLALTNINFNLHNLWNDDPFNLTLTDDTLKKDKVPVAISANNAILQNGDKSDDMLWKALTAGSSEQHDIKSEMSSFTDLCESYKNTNKPNIETFFNLMHSFKVNENEITNSKDNIEFKHVKAAKLPIDGAKYWDKLDNSNTNQVNGFKINLSNGDSVNEKEANGNEQYLTEGTKKESSEEYLLEHAPPQLNYKDTKLNNTLSDEDEVKLDPVKQDLIKMGLPTSFGKKRDERHRRTQNYYYKVNNERYSSETAINEQTVVDISTASGIKIQGECLSKANNEGKTDIGPEEQTVVDVNGTVLENTEQDSHNKNCSQPNSNQHERTTNTTEIESQAVRKNQQNGNSSITQTYYHSNDIDSNNVPHISSSKTFTRENSEPSIQSTTVLESDPSDCGSSCDEDNALYKSDYDETCHQAIKDRHSMEYNRGKQFDTWYKQLEFQTKSIQYALYIEELHKL